MNKAPEKKLVGEFKRFGPFGPAYKVIKLLHSTAGGDWLLRIVILESGEEADYLYSHFKNDPEAN
jgi:hypothetical protein